MKAYIQCDFRDGSYEVRSIFTLNEVLTYR